MISVFQCGTDSTTVIEYSSTSQSLVWYIYICKYDTTGGSSSSAGVLSCFVAVQVAFTEIVFCARGSREQARSTLDVGCVGVTRVIWIYCVVVCSDGREPKE